MLFWKDVGNGILLDRSLAVQIAPELPTVTALYSLKLISRRNLVGTAAAMQT